MKCINKIKINKKNINELDYSVSQYWDDSLSGFGIRINKNTASYIYKYRNKYGQPHNITIGKVNSISPEKAREMALKYSVEVIEGGDPSMDKYKLKRTATISEVCDIYLEEGCAHKKLSTKISDMGRINTIIKPLVGDRMVASFSYEDACRLVTDIIKGDKIRQCKKLDKPRAIRNVKGGAGAALRTMQMFKAIMNFAVKRGLIDKNPVIGVQLPKSNKREAYLNEDEIKRLGQVMSRPENQSRYKKDIDIIKLCLLTGCRSGEILGLTWDIVNFEEHCFDFEDTKTGKQKRAFGEAAEHLLLSLKQERDYSSKYVFPGDKPGTHKDDVIERLKYFIRQTDELGSPVTTKAIVVHSLRHTYATMANMLNYSELIIAGLLGHKVASVTSRYAHNVDKNLISAATEVSNHICGLLNS